MRLVKTFALLAGFILMVSACTSDSKADSWNDEQKEQWTKKCLSFMEAQEVDQAKAEDFCDCMLQKTSENYTPEEAAKITEEEERKLWESCDYQW